MNDSPNSALNPRISSKDDSKASPRSDLYKNKDKNSKELRRRRSETVVELRKQKKDHNIDKRRNLWYECWSDEEGMTEEDDENKEDDRTDVDLILQTIRGTNDYDIPAQCVRRLRRLLTKGLDGNSASKEQLISALMTEDMVMKLINCITSDECSMAVLYEVLALLAVLCSGDKNQTLVLVKLGIVEHMLALLSYDDFGVIEQSVLALTYIWNSCSEMRQMINETQFLNALVAIVESETSVSPSKYAKTDRRIGLVRTTSWSLYMMCSAQELNSYRLSDALIPYFVKLLQYCDNEVKTNVLKALSSTTERVFTIPEDTTSPVLTVVNSVVSNSALMVAIIDSLTPSNNDVVLYAIRLVANIVSWGESFAQLVIQFHALNQFDSLLTHSNSNVQREAAYAVSNITAGNYAQIQAVIDANIIPSIVELLYMGDYRTQIEASHVLLNITSVGCPQQVSYLVNLDRSVANMDVVDAMATLLTSSDAKAIETCLQFYNNLLVFAQKGKQLGAVVKRCDDCSAHYHIESLQNYKNTNVAVLATHIIDTYMGLDSSFEEDLSVDTSLGSDVDKKMEFNFSF